MGVSVGWKEVFPNTQLNMSHLPLHPRISAEIVRYALCAHKRYINAHTREYRGDTLG